MVTTTVTLSNTLWCGVVSALLLSVSLCGGVILQFFTDCSIYAVDSDCGGDRWRWFNRTLVALGAYAMVALVCIIAYHVVITALHYLQLAVHLMCAPFPCISRFWQSFCHLVRVELGVSKWFTFCDSFVVRGAHYSPGWYKLFVSCVTFSFFWKSIAQQEGFSAAGNTLDLSVCASDGIRGGGFVAKVCCQRCGCNVNPDNHVERCVVPVASGLLSVLRRMAWIGDVFHYADVYIGLQSVGVSPSDIRQDAGKYIHHVSQAEYYKLSNTGLAFGQSGRSFAEAFEASYQGQYRAAYLKQVFGLDAFDYDILLGRMHELRGRYCNGSEDQSVLYHQMYDIGDIIHTIDLRYIILSRQFSDANLQPAFSGYVTHKRLADYMRSYRGGCAMPMRGASDFAMARAFKASYHGRFRVEYLTAVFGCVEFSLNEVVELHQRLGEEAGSLLAAGR